MVLHPDQPLVIRKVEYEDAAQQRRQHENERHDDNGGSVGSLRVNRTRNRVVADTRAKDMPGTRPRSENCGDLGDVAQRRVSLVHVPAESLSAARSYFGSPFSAYGSQLTGLLKRDARDLERCLFGTGEVPGGEGRCSRAPGRAPRSTEQRSPNAGVEVWRASCRPA